MGTLKQLQELQSLQIWALEHKVYSFQIESEVSPYEDEGEGAEGLIRDYGDTHERIIRVVIFKEGTLDDGDYLSEHFHQDDTDPDVFRATNRIKAFIGCIA